MKREKWFSCLTGAVLAFILSCGTVGAMVTAFDLTVGSMGRLFLICCAFSALSAVCFLIKRGSLFLLCGIALLAGFLWRDGKTVSQILSLLYQISKLYDSAYGWGIFYYGSGGGSVDYPMGILGAVVAMAVSWTVCRRQSIWPTAAAVLVPLCSCLVVMDTVPEEGYLYLILLGFLILVMTNTVRRKNALQGITLTAIVSAPLALALAVAFWLAPQESYVNRVPDIQQQAADLILRLPELWEQIAEKVNPGAADDKTDSVDLEAVGPRAELTYEVMDVFGTVDGVLYLRGQDYDLYSGTGWTASMRPQEDFPGDPGGLVPAGTVTVETRRLRDILYLPYYPMEPVSMSGVAYNTDKVKRYVFTRGVLPQGWRGSSYGAGELTEAQTRAEEQARERYLFLPADTAEGAEKLLEAVLTEGMTRTEQADAIASYVRGSARYDLKTGRMPPEAEDFALWFLEESETGYCVHFATAAAVLLRAADIPARYVTGYMIWAEANKTVTVTAGEAHAWVEYYEPALDAWIVLEATPTDQTREETVPGTEAEATGATEIPGETAGSTASHTEPTEVSAEGPADTTGAQETPFAEKPIDLGWLWRLLTWVVILAALAAAVPAQRSLRLRLRHRRRGEAAPNALALLQWREAVVRSRLLSGLPPRELERLAQKAKFSQYTLSEDELGRFAAYLAETEAELRAKPWYWQILLRYVLVIY